MIDRAYSDAIGAVGGSIIAATISAHIVRNVPKSKPIVPAIAPMSSQVTMTAVQATPAAETTAKIDTISADVVASPSGWGEPSAYVVGQPQWAGVRLAVYGFVRKDGAGDRLIRRHPWLCAEKRRSLASRGTV